MEGSSNLGLLVLSSLSICSSWCLYSSPQSLGAFPNICLFVVGDCVL